MSLDIAIVFMIIGTFITSIICITDTGLIMMLGASDVSDIHEYIDIYIYIYIYV